MRQMLKQIVPWIEGIVNRVAKGQTFKPQTQKWPLKILSGRKNPSLNFFFYKNVRKWPNFFEMCSLLEGLDYLQIKLFNQLM
jgi:hypothetical protein